MTSDLRWLHWLPLRRFSGRVEWSPPSALVSDLADDPVVAIASPRPDFDGATTEFLIGLVAAAMLPPNEEAWLARWEQPPTEADLAAALAALPAAFELLGDGPAFFQDLDAAGVRGADPRPIEQLLADAPGDETRKKNTDLFVKRDQVPALGRPAAAMALLTLQTYAPAGGKGNRVGLRGGGPLTTLVDPRPAPGQSAAEYALWRLVWANVPSAELLGAGASVPVDAAPAAVFPWLGPTRTSDGDPAQVTRPEDAHPLRAFFGLPRRLRLLVGSEPGVCALTGRPDEVMVTGFAQRPYGEMYQNWEHLLSPHYQAKAQGWLPVHAQPEGLGWRDWIGLFLGDAAATRRPARVVAAWRDARGSMTGVPRPAISVFGYDFDNMKARAWQQGRFPAFAAPPADVAEVRRVAQGLVEATRVAASLLQRAVTDVHLALSDAEGAELTRCVWQALEESFYRRVFGVLDNPDAAGAGGAARSFLRTLRHVLLAQFDQRCPMGDSDPSVARRIVRARVELSWPLAGSGKLGAKLHTLLEMPTEIATDPVKKPKGKSSRAPQARGDST